MLFDAATIGAGPYGPRGCLIFAPDHGSECRNPRGAHAPLADSHARCKAPALLRVRFPHCRSPRRPVTCVAKPVPISRVHRTNAGAAILSPPPAAPPQYFKLQFSPAATTAPANPGAGSNA